MARRVDKVERVADLLFTLLNTQEPLSLVEIGAQIPGYPPGGEALRTQFERDKRTLRDSGIPITVGQPNSSAQDGYQILAANYYLTGLALNEAEQQALALALAVVRLEGTQQAEIAVKIGAAPESAPLPVMVLPSAPALGQLGQAIRSRSAVAFTYRGLRRNVEPHVLVFRSGSWYLVGRDASIADNDARRTFRVDRISGKVVAGEPGSFDLPDDYDPTHELNFSLRAPITQESVDDARERQLTLVVQASEVAGVVGLVGRDVVRSRDEMGNATMSFAIGDEDAVVSWILGLGDAVCVLEPTSLRERIIAELQAAALADPMDPLVPGELMETEWIPPSVSAPETRSPVLDAGARLRRMIAMLTYLAQEGSASIKDLSERFDVAPATVVSELELAACVGVPPYTPYELLEIVVHGGEVYVHQLEALRRPLRLTPDEGFALATAARTLLLVAGVDADGALATGLAKLEEVLGHDRVHVDVVVPESLGELRQAAATNTIVEIDYLATSTGQKTTRRVEPAAVSLREGQFYLDAYCQLARGWRRFRIANIAAVRMTEDSGEPRTVPTVFLGSRAFVADENTQQATIVLPERHQVLIEQFLQVPPKLTGDGRVLVQVPVGSERWLGCLLLRLGDQATVAQPPHLRGVAAEVAKAALALYETNGSPQ